MSGRKYTGHSVLIVSSSEPFAAAAKRACSDCMTVDVRKSAAAARRTIMERPYDLIVINAPLPDETGEDLAMDTAREFTASVILAVPPEVYDLALSHVTEQGIMALAKPLTQGRLTQSVRLLLAVQNKMGELRARLLTTEERMEELRIVDKAKFVLIEKKHLTEDEAHRMIGREAMNNGVSRRRIAERILEEFDPY